MAYSGQIESITWDSNPPLEVMTMESNWSQYIDTGGTYTITTTDGTAVTTDRIEVSGNKIDFSGYVVSASDSDFSPSALLPTELTVCQICGAEEVVVFCDECKDILQLARKEWAKATMREIENDLS